jgi:hypothetical protein
MRFSVLGLVTLAAVQIVGAQWGMGQESFFNEQFCTRPGSEMGGSGAPDCSFHTWQQCIESARGLGRYCTENPFWRGPREPPTTEGRKRRRTH